MSSASESGTSEPAAASIALAHDWLVGYRGGEAVLDAIAQAASSIGRVQALFTLFDDGRPLRPAIDALPHVVWPIGRSRAGLRLRRWLLPLYPLGVASLSRELARAQRGNAAAQRREQGGIDLLISTSSAAIHGLRSPGAHVPHLCYCHSPPRYLWHQREDYSGGMRGLALRILSPWLRALDRRAGQGPPRRPGGVTRWIANSTHTRDRLRESYGVNASVIHPPVRTEFFTPRVVSGAGTTDSATDTRRDGGQAYMLYAGALEPYKRVDLAIAACAQRKTRLIVAGTGSDERRLRALASASSVEFVGRVSDERLRDLYRDADALLYPQCEDFGISAVEAQACGTPVVAFGRGGVLDSVIDGMTGVLCARQDAESLADGLQRVHAMREAATARVLSGPCRSNAERFSESRFMRQIRAEIITALASAAGSQEQSATGVSPESNEVWDDQWLETQSAALDAPDEALGGGRSSTEA